VTGIDDLNGLMPTDTGQRRDDRLRCGIDIQQSTVVLTRLP
jgi:hypothetical protein